MQQQESMTTLTAIKAFFGNKKPVQVQELKALSKAEREELGREAARIMGSTIVTPASNSATAEE